MQTFFQLLLGLYSREEGWLWDDSVYFPFFPHPRLSSEPLGSFWTCLSGAAHPAPLRRVSRGVLRGFLAVFVVFILSAKRGGIPGTDISACLLCPVCTLLLKALEPKWDSSCSRCSLCPLSFSLCFLRVRETQRELSTRELPGIWLETVAEHVMLWGGVKMQMFQILAF